MKKDNVKRTIEILEKEIDKFSKKDFKVFFFVIDSENNPSGFLTYIYETALTLHNMGYNVNMLHQAENFVGVGEWLGEKYAMLPHLNIEKDNVSISPSDFLFIPEIYSSVMSQTKNLPCKRIAILQNHRYMTKYIPAGTKWSDMGVYDAVVTSETLANRLKVNQPNIKTEIVRPSISEHFKNKKDKKIIINVVGQNEEDINHTVKQFVWQYPTLNWVCIRQIGGESKENFAQDINEGAITVWLDTKTDFGYTPIEAMKAGNIVIGKIPETIPEWLMGEDMLKDNGLWFNNDDESPKLIAAAVRAFINDEVPNEMFDEMEKTYSKYSPEKQKEDIKRVYVDTYFVKREEELKETLKIIKNNAKKSE